MNSRILILLAATLTLQSCEQSISTGNYRLYFPKGPDGYGVTIEEEGEIISSQTEAAIISIKEDENLTYASSRYSNSYSSVKKKGKRIFAESSVTTSNGSEFLIKDSYYVLSDHSFAMSREVSVREAAKGDLGFSSSISMPVNQGSGRVGDYDYFIPSILYKNTDLVRETAVGADLGGERMYVKETRCGMPMAMARDIASGHTLSILHYHPEICVNGIVGGGEPGEINDSLQYGSLGYNLKNLAIDFVYPCFEGPRNYEPRVRSGNGGPAKEMWYGRFHSVAKDSGHKYEVALILNRAESYVDAMMESFKEAYSLEDPSIYKMDIEEIYKNNIELFKAEYKSFGTGKVIAAGLPWSLDLPDGKNTEGVSFQMGFVGQQIACGYHLYRYGRDYNDPEAVVKGKAIVDFWTSDTIMGDYFPIVWWDPANDATAGHTRGYPSFLRCFVDGMEGLLDACRISEAYGDRQEKWEQALNKVASNLVAKQNDDGSFYRAYSENGEIAKDWDRNTQGSSKLNTPVAVRFLVKMYEHTGDEKYKEAAIKAADFSYNEIFIKEGKYVGGTPDNPNTVDKEAAIFALYAFNAVHELTGDPKYLKAAEHAGISVMSWAYCYDFAVPNKDAVDAGKNPFSNGGTLGYSIIATGHSGADNFIGYVFYEVFKLYIKTGNKLYLDMARFLEHDTKLNTDYDGKMNFKYKAFMPEATNIADMSFRSVSLWLPWCSIANIEPIVYLEEAFGAKDIDDINAGLPDLQKKLSAYGVGGRPLNR